MISLFSENILFVYPEAKVGKSKPNFLGRAGGLNRRLLMEEKCVRSYFYDYNAYINKQGGRLPLSTKKRIYWFGCREQRKNMAIDTRVRRNR